MIRYQIWGAAIWHFPRIYEYFFYLCFTDFFIVSQSNWRISNLFLYESFISSVIPSLSFKPIYSIWIMRKIKYGDVSLLYQALQRVSCSLGTHFILYNIASLVWRKFTTRSSHSIKKQYRQTISNVERAVPTGCIDDLFTKHCPVQ
jgi:hypothetical protein